MRILITTGVYPPEIGGPAQYAVGLEEGFKLEGHEVRVRHFGPLKKFPTGIRHVLFFLNILPSVWWADRVLSLDTYSVGGPSAWACTVLKTPLTLRIGGDFLWESYINRTNEAISIPDFYTENPELTLKEKFIRFATGFVLKRSQVVYSTKWQRDIWALAYPKTTKGIHVIENVVPKQTKGEDPAKKNFMWYTRDILLKNGDRLRRAFRKVQEKHPDISLDVGQVSKEELLGRMKTCWAVILPSISEVSPNYILDGLRFGKPFIMTKHSGYAEWLAPYGYIVDPADIDDMAEKIELLADDEERARAVERACSFEGDRTFDDVARDFLKLWV